LALSVKVVMLLLSIVGDRVGKEVGLPLGDAVGVALGDAVGEELGLALGEELGLALGDAVGEELGLALGEELGLALGLVEGIDVGGRDGERLGCFDGDVEGEAEGACVITRVGGCVGLELGLREGTLGVGDKVGAGVTGAAAFRSTTNMSANKLVSGGGWELFNLRP
jgi:hypothetical protein